MPSQHLSLEHWNCYYFAETILAKKVSQQHWQTQSELVKKAKKETLCFSLILKQKKKKKLTTLKLMGAYKSVPQIRPSGNLYGTKMLLQNCEV